MVRSIHAALIAICLMLTLHSLSTAKGSPAEEIRVTIDAILNLLRDSELALPENSSKRRERILSLIRDRFDFEEMARRSLARHWNKRTTEEKREFVSLFSRQIESLYIGRIESYTNEKVTVDKDVIKGDGRYGVVNTSIVTKDVTIPIDYKLMLNGERWLVYDVLIEGVSFIRTYRGQYNEILSKEPFEGLLKRMKEKLKD